MARLQDGSKEAQVRALREARVVASIPSTGEYSAELPSGTRIGVVSSTTVAKVGLSAAKCLDDVERRATPDDVRREIEAEAFNRWRSWKPTPAEKSRPTRQHFIRAVQAERSQQQETSMRSSAKKRTSKTPARKKTTSTARRARKGNARGAVKQESKSATVDRLLNRPNGATRKELSDATGWPHVNLKVAAERGGKSLVAKDDRFRLVSKDAPKEEGWAPAK